MKKQLIFLGAVLVAWLPCVNATPINVTVSGGVSVVAAPKSDLGNFGDATVLSWLGSDISSYNTLTSSSLPAPTTILGQVGLSGGTSGNSITLNVTGFDFLFFHWGGQHGGWAQAFYVGSSAGSYTFDNSAIGTNPDVGGLSFYSFYGPTLRNIPDGGSTIMLFGVALSGLGMLVRRCK